MGIISLQGNMRDKTNKTLGLVITDGVGVRNFVHGRFLSTACNTFDQVVLFSGVPSNTLGSLDFRNLKVVSMDIFYESRWSSFWRKTAEMAHLFRFQTPAMREIVKMNFDQDEFKFLCLKVLSGELSNEQKPMAATLWSKCIEYANEKIEADLRLTGLRVDAEMTRLQTSSNDQFESFWKTISAPDGSAIDPVRLQAVRQKSVKVLRWPDCFKEAGTKEETRQCFMRLVSFRRDDLLQAATQP
jgi:hypothetical protein